MSFIFNWIYSGFSSVLQFLGKFSLFSLFGLIYFCCYCIKWLFTFVIFKHSRWLNNIWFGVYSVTFKQKLHLSILSISRACTLLSLTLIL